MGDEMERWVIVNEDGSLILHSENDGWAYMKKGPEATDEPVTLEELKNYGMSSSGPYGVKHWTLYDEAVKQLKEKGFPIPQD